MSVLALFVALIGSVVGLAVVGIGWLVYRRPALKTPVVVAASVAGVLIAFMGFVVNVAHATARDDGAGPSSSVSPSGR